MPRLSADRAETFYRDTGHGDPVLLLHAGASSSVQWERLAGELAAVRRCLAPDLYGHGLTPCPEDMTPETLLSRQVDVLAALLAAAGGPADVVGHSYGAVLALRLAVDRPALVASLALVEPVALGLLADDDPALREILGVEAACRARVEAGDPEAATREFLAFWSDPVLWDILPPGDQAAIVAGARERHFIGGPAVFGARFTAAELAGVAVPTLVLTGDEGPAATRAVAGRLAAALPRVAAETVPGAGHMLPLTHHRRFTRRLLAHLDAAR